MPAMESGAVRQSLWMLVASFFFALMGVCVKLAASQHAPVEIVFYRSAISLVLAALVANMRGTSLLTTEFRLHLARGLTGFAALWLFFAAIAGLPLATAITLNYTSPLFLAGFLVALTGLRLRLALGLALLGGFLGVAWLLQPTFAGHQWLPGLMGLGSGALAGLAYYLVRKLGARGEPESRTVFYFALIACAGSGMWMVVGAPAMPTLQTAGWLLGVGVFATIAQLAMTRAYKRGAALATAGLAYMTVVFSSLFAALVWGEMLPLTHLLAIAVIVVSGVAASWFSQRFQAAQA